jgi:hypothetical protein
LPDLLQIEFVDTPNVLGTGFTSTAAPSALLRSSLLVPPNQNLRSCQQSSVSFGSGPFAHRCNKTTGSEQINKGAKQMYMNQLTIIGFIGQDADFHYTPNGAVVTTFSMATKESWNNDEGEWQSRTDWHRVVTFGKLAEYTRTLPRGHM